MGGAGKGESAMSITQDRMLVASLTAHAAEQGISSAPLPRAEQLARAALADGATPAEALARGASYLRSWSLHPSNTANPRHLRAAV